jgi:hypothetical protein
MIPAALLEKCVDALALVFLEKASEGKIIYLATARYSRGKERKKIETSLPTQ